MQQTPSILPDLKSRGFVLHPLRGKIPLLPGWQKLTATPEIIDLHVEKGGNVGAVCGKVSNITVIDLDSFLFAPEIFGAGIDTLKALRTEGRGHVYFKYNPNLPASKHHDLGIEILSDGNNIVLPGSVHPSGDMYRWKNPDAPILEMPPEIEKNLITLFTTETELKRMLAKCRHCFRKAISEKPEVHGAEGREYMLSICTDLKAQGATEPHIKVFAKLMYGAKFDEIRTLQEWQNIDPAKTWTCDKLREKCAAHIDLNKCEQCKERKEARATSQPTIIDFTDEGNAQRFAHLHGKNIRYIPKWETWMVWDGRIWVRKKSTEMTPFVKLLVDHMYEFAKHEDTDQAEKIRKHAISLGGLTKIKACIFLAQNQPGISCEPDEFDKNPYLINFANGTIELKTKTLRDFRREDMMTKCSPHIYDPTFPYPLFLKFLDQIFEGKQDIIKYIQTLFGMCMTGDVSQEQLFIFWGATGGNGKGTLVEFMAYILSDYRVALPITALLAHSSGSSIPADIARLKGARLCTVNEPPQGMVLSDGKVKEITGKDPFPARFMRENFFDITPSHHTVITSNPKPLMNLSDGGMRRRVVLIPFYYSPHPDDIDRHLDEKLRPEAPGVIEWLLDGCLRWQKEGLVQPQEIKDCVADYREEMDPLLEFWNICVEKHIGAVTPTSLLFSIYKLWCEAAEVHAKGSKGFTQLLYNSGYRKADGRINGTFARAITGLRPTQKALDIITRYNTSPGSEHAWAIEQFKMWESWKPATDMEKMMRHNYADKALKELTKEYGADKPSPDVADDFLKVFFEDAIEDEDRAKIVAAYFAPAIESGPAQRDRLKTIRDIIRDNQKQGAVTAETIIQKAQEAGISKGDTEDMLQKLKSSGEVIEASDSRYRAV